MSQVELIRALSSPMTVEPAGETARLKELPGIRAIIFDIYGTLFLSGAGEISLGANDHKDQAMLAALQAESIVTTPTMALEEDFNQLINQNHAKSMADGIAFPEVEIREVWQSLMKQHGLNLSDEAVERVAIRYECAVNPVWPMPGCEQTILSLRDLGMRLGIISNAQFFTPPLFDALLQRSSTEFGFADEFGLWSYREREAKPSKGLFVKMANLLSRQGIKTGEAIYVGNDMRNDIATAQAVGYHTALFAGDARSLRWRRDDNIAVEPDIVLTELSQLLHCLIGEDLE